MTVSPFVRNLLCAACLLSAALAGAEKADRSKPMHIESDVLRHDDQRQVSVFSGRVVLTKGTILIRGGEIEVRQDAQGNQFGRISAEPGKLAYFRQKREGVDEYMEGEARTIDYDGQADTVKLLDDATLRRLRGATLADEVSGKVIQYNNGTEVFTVDGGAVPSGATGRGRVRTMLTPRPDAAPDASAPVSPLRTTPLLGGGKP